MSTRVAITGIGLVTPLGNDRKAPGRRFLRGSRALALSPASTPAAMTCASPPRSRTSTRSTIWIASWRGAPIASSQFALAAAKEASSDSGLDIASMPDDVGVVVGSGSGGLWTLEEELPCTSSRSGPTASARSSSR